MDVEKETAAKGTPEAVERSPRTHVDSQPLPTDSMVTVPLSETDAEGAHPAADHVSALLQQPDIVVEEKRQSSRPSSAEIMKAFGGRSSQDGSIRTSAVDSPTISLPDDDDTPPTPKSGERSRSNSEGSSQSAQVDWTELEKKEEQESQEEGQDEVSVGSPCAPRSCVVTDMRRPWPCCLLD